MTSQGRLKETEEAERTVHMLLRPIRRRNRCHPGFHAAPKLIRSRTDSLGWILQWFPEFPIVTRGLEKNVMHVPSPKSDNQSHADFGRGIRVPMMKKLSMPEANRPGRAGDFVGSSYGKGTMGRAGLNTEKRLRLEIGHGGKM